MKKFVYFTLVWMVFLFSSCVKDPPKVIPVTSGSLVIKVDYKVDGKPLIFDSLMYTNTAGNLYSVSRLEYFLSGFVFEDMSGNFIQSDMVLYENAKKPVSIILTQLKFGNYKSVQFNVGIDSIHNISNSLEPTPENLNMFWPDEMGGGYHFTKLEGRYLNAASTTSGFAMHIGTNKTLVKHNKLTVSKNVTENTTDTLQLTMNINEWFTNPNQYNLLIHGNYTMGNDSLMLMLKENAKDIFY